MARHLVSPLASLSLLVLGTQFFQIYVTMGLAASGHSEFAIGIVHSASYFGLLISAIHSEKLIHRIGHIRAFNTFSSVITGCILIQAFSKNIGLWMVARFCSGLSLAALYVTIESWLLAESTIDNRGKRLAIYMLALYISQAISPQFFNFIEASSLHPFLLAGILCALANIPVNLTRHSTPALPVRKPLKILEVYSLNPYAFLGCFISGIALSSLYSFMPKYASDMGLPIAGIMSTLICGGFLLQWPLGRLSDVFNRQKVLVVLALCSTIPGVALTYGIHTFTVYCMAFLVGGITFALYPISISLACDRLEHRCIVQTTGVLLFSYSLGSVLGPILVSLGIECLKGSWVLFAFISAAVGSYGLYGAKILFNRTASEIAKDEHTVECIPLPKQSPIANELDPRQEESEVDSTIASNSFGNEASEV